jgi:hypothetical protein
MNELSETILRMGKGHEKAILDKFKLQARIDDALDQINYIEKIVGERHSLNQLRCILKGESWLNPDVE